MEIKDFLRCIKRNYLIRREFRHECKEYIKYNYNNPNQKSFNSYQAKIYRQIHVIEKALSLSNTRKGFGTTRVQELFVMMDQYLALGFDTEEYVFQAAIEALNRYIEFQHSVDYDVTEIEKRAEKYHTFYKHNENVDAGAKEVDYMSIKKAAGESFVKFVFSRHSVRQFDTSKKVAVEDIEKAVALAKKSPSACNRQASKVYVFENSEDNSYIGKYVKGNTGFEAEVDKYLVVTADRACFYNAMEINQEYIDGAIFGTVLTYALHFYGIASCILQNGQDYKATDALKERLGIPESERIVFFIAIGAYKENFKTAVSQRKKMEDVLIVRK